MKFNLPLLPLRDIVVFPNMVIPLFVGRDKSINALNEVMKKEKKIILDDLQKFKNKNIFFLKSNIFINGILDKTIKDFQESGRLNKAGRGLI